MSHIVTIRTEVRDPAAIHAACRRLGLASPKHGTARLFGGEATGWIVELPGWKFPIVCQTESGELQFDNYEGRWGEQSKLDSFLQAYAVEKARLEARKRGHSVREQPLADGSIVEGGSSTPWRRVSGRQTEAGAAELAGAVPGTLGCYNSRRNGSNLLADDGTGNPELDIFEQAGEWST